MEITIQVPESVTGALGYSPQDFSDRALAGLLINECVRGRISRGKVAEILGLSFHEAEELFRSRHVPYSAKTAADDAAANESIRKQP